jgi:hypothetical protein
MSANRSHKLYSYPFKPMALPTRTVDAMLAELATARVEVETDTGPHRGTLHPAALVCVYFADACGDDIEMAKVPHHAEAAARRWVIEFNKEVARRTLSLAA